ncbi:MAG: hypothetical protein PHG11_08850 [Eubacteriales bacterium]|nr:hypothetical protein [Eubacteriales bacterium]
MPLKEIVDSLEGIDEKYADLYIENSDGKFEINITGLKSALAKERQLKKDLEKKLLKNKDSNQDPDLNDLKKELEKANGVINEMKITGKIKNAAISAGVDPDYIDDVITLTKSNFGLDDNGDVVVLDGTGSPSSKNVGNFFKGEFKKNKPRYFVSSGKKGSGSAEAEILNPTSMSGKLNKAIKERNVSELIKIKQSKINKIGD